ncbi:MAG: glycyl-radical enzyme activating protein [Desulfitobacterium hafniense]|nr:glycyl-radical enzyme activating protein [Desulfitobacterium hafniense]
MLKEITGRIFNIQKYSVHDGPGIRDVVFMKGCPLKCIWCSNPESQSSDLQIAYNITKCIGVNSCGHCIKACTFHALSVSEDKIVLDRRNCVNCNKCVDICCSKALHIFGKDMTIDEVFQKTQNQAGAWRSNGGITVSGGEPLLQADFVAALLKEYRNIGVHTAIETTGFVHWEKLKQVAQWCNLIHFDVKMLDAQKHRKYTGVDNIIILENLKKLSAGFPNVNIIVRTPVIPDINDQECDITEIAEYLKTLPNLYDYELLPYHGYGRSKYEQLEMAYELKGVASLEKSSIYDLNQCVREMLDLPRKTYAGHL